MREEFSMIMNGSNFSIPKISNTHHFLPHKFEKSREGDGMKVRINVSKEEKSWERGIGNEIKTNWLKNHSHNQILKIIPNSQE